MKTLLVCLLVSAFSVDAHFDRPGLFGQCTCRGWWNRNPCRGVVGAQVQGCPNTNKYLQCNGQVCSNLTCPAGQVWNNKQNACAQCASGMHVADNKQVCVCNQGTTLDPRNNTCAPCPTNSTHEADKCYCPVTKANDYKTNACRDCPAGSALTIFQQCRCNSTQFFSDNEWACKDCPGEWLPKTTRRFGFFRPTPARCTCTGTNQIFDRINVRCFTCPTGTTASFDNSNCECANRFQFFNMESQKCECVWGYEADASGTGCVRSALTTTTTPAAGPFNTTTTPAAGPFTTTTTPAAGNP